MNELRFKLKKDGKTVGYMKIDVRGVRVCFEGDPGWNDYLPGYSSRFDSIHPWVCQDRDGNDVYCDDQVKVWSGETVEHIVTVHWDNNQKAFLFDEFKRGWPCFYSQYEGIELLPESQKGKE